MNFWMCCHTPVCQNTRSKPNGLDLKTYVSSFELSGNLIYATFGSHWIVNLTNVQWNRIQGQKSVKAIYRVIRLKWMHFRLTIFHDWIKWRIFSQPGKIGSGKNKKNLYFSYVAWKSPWGHGLSLITFCQIPVLSWAIWYSVFQVKLTST